MSHAISDRKWEKKLSEKCGNCVDRAENTLGLCKKVQILKPFP